MTFKCWFPALVAVELAAVAGAAFSPVFPGGTLALPLVAALAPVALADLVVLRKPALVRWRALLASSAGLLILSGLLLRDTLVAGLPTAGTARRLWSGAVDSWARTLDTTWPATPEADLFLFVPLLTLATGVVTVELLRRVGPLAALLPPLITLVLSQAFIAQVGTVGYLLAVVFAVLSAVLLATGREPTAFRRSGRIARLAALFAVVLVTAPAAAVADPLDREPYSLKDRRESEVLPSTVTSPLEDVSARLAEPDSVLFRARTNAAVETWRLAVLQGFDGSAWTVDADFVPLGEVLQADPEVTAPVAQEEAAIVLEGLEGPFLPSRLRTVSFAGLRPAVDPESGSLISGRAEPGLQYSVVWRRPLIERLDLDTPLLGSAGPVGIPPPALTELAAQLSSEDVAPTFRTALRLEQFLRDNYKQAVEPPLPAGAGYPQLVDFLIDSKSGTSEQFAASYVVLARLMGIPSRLAVGFRNPESTGDGAYVVRNRDAFTWPEVRVAGLGWVALDPTSSTLGGRTSDRRDLESATEEARQELRENPSGDDEAPTPAPSQPGPARESRVWLLSAVPALVLALLAVPVAKAVRARRRRSRTPAGAVVGAWQEVRDRLADAGVELPPGLTVREFALAAGDQLDTAGAVGLATIGRCVDETLWSGRQATPELARDAWAGVHQVRRDLRKLPWRTRLRAALDPRSLPGWPAQALPAHSQTAPPTETRLLR